MILFTTLPWILRLYPRYWRRVLHITSAWISPADLTISIIHPRHRSQQQYFQSLSIYVFIQFFICQSFVIPYFNRFILASRCARRSRGPRNHRRRKNSISSPKTTPEMFYVRISKYSPRRYPNYHLNRRRISAVGHTYTSAVEQHPVSQTHRRPFLLRVRYGRTHRDDGRWSLGQLVLGVVVRLLSLYVGWTVSRNIITCLPTISPMSSPKVESTWWSYLRRCNEMQYAQVKKIWSSHSTRAHKAEILALVEL